MLALSSRFSRRASLKTRQKSHFFAKRLKCIILLLHNVTIRRFKSQDILPCLVPGQRLPGIGGPREKTAAVSLVLADFGAEVSCEQRYNQPRRVLTGA